MSLLRRQRATVAMSPMQLGDLPYAADLCAQDPISSVMVTMHVERSRASHVVNPGALWKVVESGTMVGVVYAGANVVPIVPDISDDIMAGLAHSLRTRLGKPASLVGPAPVVHDLWGRVEKWWGPARDIRATQYSMAICDRPAAFERLEDPDGMLVAAQLGEVRPSVLADFEALMPACVAMFIEEVGFSPLLGGKKPYEDRVQWLIRAGHSYVQMGLVDGARQVVFKAEVGALGGGVAQLQGVWVHPSLRGLGLARAGMSAVVTQVRAQHARTVSLYVNDYNPRAIASYEAAGFERVGTFATVML